MRFFGGLAEHIQIPKRIVEGKIIKRSCTKENSKGRKTCYDLVIGQGEDEWIIGDVVSTFNDAGHAHETRLLSQMLRHGIPISHLTSNLGRDLDKSMFSFSKVMARVLKKYAEDGAESGENCSECGEKMVFSDGCMICMSCGASPKCG